jgi:NADH-quinone oxidoreductase subunit L
LISDKLFVGTVSIDFGLWCFPINNIQWNFIIDSMTGVMLVVVTTISLFVHLYSVSYMRYDPHVIRFFSYLSLFTFFMLMLVSSSNLMMLFIGW